MSVTDTVKDIALHAIADHVSEVAHWVVHKVFGDDAPSGVAERTARAMLDAAAQHAAFEAANEAAALELPFRLREIADKAEDIVAAFKPKPIAERGVRELEVPIEIITQAEFDRLEREKREAEEKTDKTKFDTGGDA